MPSDPRAALAEAWASPAGRKSHPRRPKQNTFCLKSTLSICCRRSLQHDAAQPGRARGTAGARELLRSCALALTLVASFAVAGCVPLQFEDVGLARAGDLSASRLLTQKVNFCCLKITWTADWCRTSDCLGLGCQTREDIACSDIMSSVCAPIVPYTTRSFCTVIESCRLATLDLEFAKRMVELYTESKPRQVCAEALTKVICSYHFPLCEQDDKTYPSLRKLGLTHTILRSHVHASFNRAPSFTVDFPTGLQLGDSFETEPLCVDADANIACLRAINTKGNDVCLKI